MEKDIFDNGQRTQMIDGLRFELTCPAFGESYDVYYNDIVVAYIRLRHGDLSLANADNTEKWWEISTSTPIFPNEYQLQGEGFFDSDKERTFYLSFMAKIIHKKLKNPDWQLWQENIFIMNFLQDLSDDKPLNN